MDSVSEDWAGASRTAHAVVAYQLRWAIVNTVLKGAAEGLTKDQLAERVRFVQKEAEATKAGSIKHARQQLLAIASQVGER